MSWRTAETRDGRTHVRTRSRQHLQSAGRATGTPAATGYAKYYTRPVNGWRIFSGRHALRGRSIDGRHERGAHDCSFSESASGERREALGAHARATQNGGDFREVRKKAGRLWRDRAFWLAKREHMMTRERRRRIQDAVLWNVTFFTVMLRCGMYVRREIDRKQTTRHRRIIFWKYVQFDKIILHYNFLLNRRCLWPSMIRSKFAM